MFCRYCGKEVPAQAIACVGCGCPPLNGDKFCSNCGVETSPPQIMCIKCGAGLKRIYSGAKSRIAAGVLGIVLGGLGVHRFYLGYTGIGIAQIILTICTCGIGAIWGFIEGIMILVGAINTDAQGRPLCD